MKFWINHCFAQVQILRKSGKLCTAANLAEMGETLHRCQSWENQGNFPQLPVLRKSGKLCTAANLEEIRETLHSCQSWGNWGKLCTAADLEEIGETLYSCRSWGNPRNCVIITLQDRHRSVHRSKWWLTHVVIVCNICFIYQLGHWQ